MPTDVNTASAWVRSLEVISVPHPKTGKPCPKLLSGWADGALRVYDIATWTLEHTLTAHSGPILAIAIVGDCVISTGADMTAAEWDPNTWTLRRVLRNHDGAVCAVNSLPDGRVLTASLDGKLKVWKQFVGSSVKSEADAARVGVGKGGGKAGAARVGVVVDEPVKKKPPVKKAVKKA